MVVNNDKDDSNDSNKTISTNRQYHGMLFVDFLSDDNEMVVVEQPWLDVVAGLPDPLDRRVYGA
eukprot:CAMPEP_0118720170 /NCGR_PEP_ID=MMETSP0800-20121206/29950_1 /TAXON_ID=210618 ORGANISM="Striatella unipunctata, Strain CCMP2910" /NCGR_SAMPLE_ID=MMETSP0800 /ASSEMBLY_ACC=CAM_ASM_000638 /LENGTH=63 /DNA_ID=CAMNT_0006627757 /DNA_START=267 /DNA_END=458 /DNA_ORIENTATION=+